MNNLVYGIDVEVAHARGVEVDPRSFPSVSCRAGFTEDTGLGWSARSRAFGLASYCILKTRVRLLSPFGDLQTQRVSLKACASII